MISEWRTRPVAGIGLVGLDHVAVTDRWEHDAKTTARDYFEQVGGPVPVALCAMARLGLEMPPAFIGAVGADSTGKLVTELLQTEGIDTTGVVRQGATPHSLIVLDTSEGTRALTNWPGGIPTLTMLTAAQSDILSTIGLLHFDARDPEVRFAAARIVHENGGLVSCDLGTMRAGCDLLIPHCDILIASKVGGAGAFPDIADDPIAQTRQFLEMGATIAGVTLGAQGVVIASRDVHDGEPTHLPAFAVSPVVDTCGAGDLFHGAFLWAYRTGYSVIDAANFAQAAVALRIQHYGNQVGLPTREAIERFTQEGTPLPVNPTPRRNHNRCP